MASENGQEKRETIADIVRKKRSMAAEIRANLSTVPVRREDQLLEADSLDREADCIEAAWKREKAEWEAAACSCVSDAVMSGKVAVEHKLVGNAAAMYDALVKIAHYCDDKDGMDDPYCADGHILSDIARAALSEPARNCDHGDYLERFKCFCRGRNCQGCKYEGDGADCYAAFLLDRAEEGGKQ